MTRQALLTALGNARKEFKPLKKSGVNSYFKTKDGQPHLFSTLDDIFEACNTALTNHNLQIFYKVRLLESNGTIVNILQTVLHHTDSGEEIVSDGTVGTLESKPQDTGGSITYMRRYHIQAMLNLEADFEDDGNQASGRNDKPDGKIIQTVMPSRTYETFDEEGNKNGTYTSFKSYAGALDIEKYKTIEEWKAPTIAQLEDIINWTESNLDKEEHKKTKMLLIKSCNTKINQITATE